MRELFGANGEFLALAFYARSDQHVFLILAYHDARNGNAFISLILMPGYQFVLMKSRLKRSVLLDLNHYIKTSYLG